MAEPWKKVTDSVTEHLMSLIDRSRASQGYFARNVYRDYQNSQRERWRTEGQSEGYQWEQIDPEYRKRKLKRFASYPGAGSKMMIATSKLQGSVIGLGEYGTSNHRALFANTYMEVSTTLSYAPYVAEKRTIMDFAEKTIDEWERKLTDFVSGL